MIDSDDLKKSIVVQDVFKTSNRIENEKQTIFDAITSLMGDLYNFALSEDESFNCLLSCINSMLSCKYILLSGNSLINILNGLMALQLKSHNSTENRTKARRAIDRIIKTTLQHSERKNEMIKKRKLSALSIRASQNQQSNGLQAAILEFPKSFDECNEEYCKTLTTYMVDQCSLYIHRLSLLPPTYPESLLPELPPLPPDAPELKNEKEISSGDVGWCSVCREAASQVCSNTLLSFCSKTCKSHFSDMIEFLDISQQKSVSISQKNSKNDLKKILSYLHKIKPSRKAVTRNKRDMYGFIGELLVTFLEGISESGSSVVQYIETRLFSWQLEALANCDQHILAEILRQIWLQVSKFRKIFKLQIAILLVEIIVPLLTHTITRFETRREILNFLKNLLSEKDVVLELYLNYEIDFMFPQVLSEISTGLRSILVETIEDEPKYCNTKEDISMLQVYTLETINSFLKALYSGLFDMDVFDDDYEEEGAHIQNTCNFELTLEHKLNRLNILKECLAKFNKKPKEGLRMLEEHNFVDVEYTPP